METKRFAKKKWLIFLLTVTFSIVLELLTRNVVNVKIIARYGAIEIGLILMLCSPILLIKSNRFSNIYSIIIMLLFSVIYFLNGNMEVNDSDFFYLRLIAFKGELENLNVLDFVSVKYLLFTLLFSSIFIALLIIINKVYKKVTCEKYRKIGLMSFSIMFLIGFGMFGITESALYRHNVQNYSSLNVESGKDIITYKTKYAKKTSFNNFGQLNFYISELGIMYFDKGNFVNTQFVDEDCLESNRFDSTSYTGLLRDYNVVTIMLETGMYDMINEELTPNLWALKNGGLDFDKNYSKNKTGVSEHIGIMGSYPSEIVNYAKTITIDAKDISLAGKFQSRGYSTKYFHNGNSMYGRNQTMTQFGFDEYNDFWQINPELPIWQFDGSYIPDSITARNITTDIYNTDQPFYSFWTTLSEHGPYIAEADEAVAKRTAYFNGDYNEYFEYLYPNNFEQLNLSAEKVEEYDIDYLNAFDNAYDNGLFSYFGELEEDEYTELSYLQCAFMDLDLGMGYMIDEMKEEGTFDNTLFIFYGDHDAYYSNLSSRLNEADETNPSIYHTELFMYNKTLTDKYKTINGLDIDVTGLKYEYFSSPYIIVPTVLDLFGMDYNKNNYYMESAFSPTSDLNNIFYSSEKQAFFTQDVFGYDGDTMEYNEGEYTDEEYKEAVAAKMTKIHSIEDLYAKILVLS